MAAVGETAVVQPDGVVGVPVISPVTSAATTANVAAPSSVAYSSLAPVVPAAAVSVQEQAPSPADTTLQNNVMAPAITQPASAAGTGVVPAAVDPAMAPAPTTNVVPPATVASASSPPIQPPANGAASTSPVTSLVSSPVPAASAPVVVETTALPAPAVAAPPPAATTNPVVVAVPPSTQAAAAVPSGVISTSLPVDKAPAASALAGSSASAIGDANVFAPAIPDTPVSSSIDPVTAIPDPSSSLSSPLAEESDAPAETSTVSAQIPSSRSSGSARSTSAVASPHHASASKTTEASDMNKSSTFSSEETQPSDSRPTDHATSTPDPSSTTDANPDTTYISGSITYTGAAAVSAAEFAKHGDHEKVAKHGISSFAIIGIVGGILVFFIILYIVWFQWRKRRSRDDDSDDGDYAANDHDFDPYGLAKEKHSGFDFIDQPLSSRFTDRHKSTATGAIANPFADPGKRREGDRDREEEYVETWYSDPGEAGLGTAKSQQLWYDDRRPSYIDGPQSIYHETNDPSDPFNQRPEDNDRPRSVPAAPPVPPVPAVYRQSTAPSRPRTDFSYGDFYGGYDSARSRPGTQFTQYTHDQPPQTPSEGMATPNTAAMLPWLHPADSPPLPSPADPRTKPSRKVTNGYGSQPKMPLRGPVAAAMAQTPQMEDRGFQGVIPTFR